MANPEAPSLARSKHAHALRGDLNSSWAARPTELTDRRRELALRVENPGGQALATQAGTPGTWELSRPHHTTKIRNLRILDQGGYK